MRVGLWASKAECAQKMSEVQQFLERNGYEYDVRMGNVVIDMNDEKFNDMTSWKVLLLLSEMKPIAKGAECFVVRTLTDLSKDMGVAKEMVHVIKAIFSLLPVYEYNFYKILLILLAHIFLYFLLLQDTQHLSQSYSQVNYKHWNAKYQSALPLHLALHHTH